MPSPVLVELEPQSAPAAPTSEPLWAPLPSDSWTIPELFAPAIRSNCTLEALLKRTPKHARTNIGRLDPRSDAPPQCNPVLALPVATFGVYQRLVYLVPRSLLLLAQTSAHSVARSSQSPEPFLCLQSLQRKQIHPCQQIWSQIPGSVWQLTGNIRLAITALVPSQLCTILGRPYCHFKHRLTGTKQPFTSLALDAPRQLAFHHSARYRSAIFLQTSNPLVAYLICGLVSWLAVAQVLLVHVSSWGHISLPITLVLLFH